MGEPTKTDRITDLQFAAGVKLARYIDQYLQQEYYDYLVAKVDLYLKGYEAGDKTFDHLFNLGGYGIIAEATNVKHNARTKT